MFTFNETYPDKFGSISINCIGPMRLDITIEDMRAYKIARASGTPMTKFTFTRVNGLFELSWDIEKRDITIVLEKSGGGDGGSLKWSIDAKPERIASLLAALDQLAEHQERMRAADD